MRRLKLFIERMLVFALGVVTAWLIAFVIFDFADKRLPTAARGRRRPTAPAPMSCCRARCGSARAS